MDRGNREPLYIFAASGALAVLYFVGTIKCYPIVDGPLPLALAVHSRDAIYVHHLILSVLGWLNNWFGFTAPSDLPKTLLLFQAYVAASSFATLALVGLLSLKWFGSLRTAMISILLTGFAFGYWLYSMMTDIPVPATAFTLMAVYWADRSFEARSAQYRMLFFASLSVFVAALNHQSHSIVVLPIAAVVLLWKKGGWSWTQRARRAALFVGITALLGAAAYFSAYRAAKPEVGFVTFVRGLEAEGRMYPSDRFQPLTPVYTAVGITRSVFFPEYALHFDSVFDSVSSRFPFRLLSKYKYLIRDLPDSLVWLLIGMSCALLAAWILLAARGLVGLLRAPPASPAFWMVFGWIVVQGMFSSWWLASSREFWIWIVPCLAMTGTGFALGSRGGRLDRFVPWVFAGTLFVTNLPAIAKTWSADNCFYQINKSFETRTRANDLVITPYLLSLSELSALHQSAARVFTARQGVFRFTSELKGILTEVRDSGGRVFIDPLLIMQEEPEINRVDLYLQRKGQDNGSRSVEADLLRLESFCETADIPLYGVWRRGGDVIALRPIEFNGYLQWVDSDLNPIASNQP